MTGNDENVSPSARFRTKKQTVHLVEKKMSFLQYLTSIAKRCYTYFSLGRCLQVNHRLAGICAMLVRIWLQCFEKRIIPECWAHDVVTNNRRAALVTISAPEHAGIRPRVPWIEWRVLLDSASSIYRICWINVSFIISLWKKHHSDFDYHH